MILEHKAAAESSVDSSDAEAVEKHNKVKQKYEDAVEGKRLLEEILYQSFINVCEHVKFQMNLIGPLTEAFESGSYTEEDLKSMTEALQGLFSRSASLLKSSLFYAMTFISYDVDITWLDEIAEGLRHLTTAINSAILSFLNI